MEIYLVQEKDYLDYGSTRILKAFKKEIDALIFFTEIEAEGDENYAYEIIPTTLVGGYE